MECRNNKHFSECNRPTGLAFRDLRSFVIRFDFESYVRFEIRFERKKRFAGPYLHCLWSDVSDF